MFKPSNLAGLYSTLYLGYSVIAAKAGIGLNSIYFETIEKQYKYYTNLSGIISLGLLTLTVPVTTIDALWHFETG